MCLERGSEVKIAKEDIVVYKVLVRKGSKSPKFYPVFHAITGASSKEARRKPTSVMRLGTWDAIGFDDEYGYMAFLEKGLAQEYIQRIRDKKSGHTKWFDNHINHLVICLFVIPKGTAYACGCIDIRMIGSGFPAIRAKRMKYLTVLQ